MKSLLNYLLLIFLVVGCSTNLSSIDRPVCVKLSASRGYCTTIISGKGQYVDEVNLLNGRTWFDSSIDMVYVPVETWAALKKYLIINCKRSKVCNRRIDTWTRSTQIIDAQLEVSKQDGLP